MRKSLALIAAIAAYAMWGLLGPLAKILLQDLSPLELNATRMILTLAVVMVLSPSRMKRDAWELAKDAKLWGVVVLGGGIDFTLYAFAIDRLDPVFATLGFYTAPLWTAVLAYALLRERVGKWFLPAVLVMLGGSFLVLAPGGNLSTSGYDHLGMFLAVLSGFGWALYAVGLRWRAQQAPLGGLMLFSFAASTLYFALIALPFSSPDQWFALSSAGWAAMSIHVLVPTIGAMVLYNLSVQHLQSSTVNLLVGVELLATIVWAALLLGDSLTGSQALGAGIVLLAVTGYLASQKPTEGE